MEESRTEEMMKGAACGGTDEVEASNAAAVESEENDVVTPLDESDSEREAYEALIKTRFRDFYAEDTQKLINRRFRKYKVMEERYRILEEKLAAKEQEHAARDSRIETMRTELEQEMNQAVKKAEDRLVRELRIKQNRPMENGLLAAKHVIGTGFSAASLTREDRERMARRVFNGEKVSF